MSKRVKGIFMIRGLIFLLLINFVSCSEEKFSADRNKDTPSSPSTIITSSSTCSDFTYIRPKVDFLFLWDNSTSSVFINNETKQALNNTIANISSKFDYHILLAPLIGTGNNEARFISYTPDNLQSSATGIRIDRSQAANSLNFTYAQGNQESGVQRAIDLIKNNVNNGIFRANSYLNIIVMSNEDDNSWANYPIADKDRTDYVSQKLHELLCLRGNYTPSNGLNCTGFNLNSLQMRFMSIVSFKEKDGSNSCGGVSHFKRNLVYKDISAKMYTFPYSNGIILSDQTLRTDLYNDPFLNTLNYDSYDICSQSSYSNIFDGINASISDTLISHKYDSWPVATAGASAIDPDEVRVFRDGVELTRLSNADPGQDGFYFQNYIQTINTRYEPTPGEPFTGYLVKLLGNARVTYPQCMTVTTESPKELFGYVNLETKPLEGSIELKINGQVVPESTTNGWQLVKSSNQPHYYTSKNIKIQGPSSTCPTAIEPEGYCGASPVLNRSGYFLQLFGTALYSNGVSIEVLYDPSN